VNIGRLKAIMKEHEHRMKLLISGLGTDEPSVLVDVLGRNSASVHATDSSKNIEVKFDKVSRW